MNWRLFMTLKQIRKHTNFLPSYTEIKLNMNMRINRVLATIETAESILFIRLEEHYEEACS